MKRTTSRMEEGIKEVLKDIVQGKGGYPPSPRIHYGSEGWKEELQRLEETPRTPEDNM